MKETDLYLPLERLLESQHYQVKGEVQDCDVLAVRGNEAPVVVELEVSHTIKLLRMLGLGLVVIHANHEIGSAQVLLDPGVYTPRKSKHRQERLLGEFSRRVGDPNLGGTEKRAGIMTAYRQRALDIGRFLHQWGPTKASRIADGGKASRGS